MQFNEVQTKLSGTKWFAQTEQNEFTELTNALLTELRKMQPLGDAIYFS